MSRKKRRQQQELEAVEAAEAQRAAKARMTTRLEAPVPTAPTAQERQIIGDLVYRPIGGNNPDDIGANTGIVEFRRYGKDSKTTRIMIDRGIQMMDGDSPYDAIMVNTDRYFGDKLTGAQPEEPVQAEFVTHAHQDHMGAIVHDVLRGKALPPIYATPLAQAYIEIQLELNGVKDREQWPEFRTLTPGKPVQVGDLHVMPIPTSHSIPESLTLAISSPTGSMVHSGDYKTDPTVPLGPRFESERMTQLGQKALARYGHERFDVATVDSTRAGNPGSTPTEEDVKNEIRDIVRQHKNNRVVTAVMGSSLERIVNMAKVAADTNRVLVIEGKAILHSLHAMVRADEIRRNGPDPNPQQQKSRKQKKGGKIQVNIGQIESILARHVGHKVRVLEGRDEAVMNLPDSKQLVLATGTQGERDASLPKAARGEHNTLVFGANDVVIRSASKIPGNEAAIDTVDAMVRSHGVKKLITTDDALVHSSGHGYAVDTDRYLEANRPRVAIPIHGSVALMDDNAQRMATRSTELDLKIERMRNGDQVTIGRDVLVNKTSQQPEFLGIRNQVEDPNIRAFVKDYAYDRVTEYGVPLNAAPAPANDRKASTPNRRAG